MIAAYLDAGQILVDEEQRNAAQAGVGVGLRRDDEEVGEQTVADEMLAAVEHPTASVRFRMGLDGGGGGGGPGAGFGHGDGTGALALDGGQEPLFALRAGAGQQDFVDVAESAADENVAGAPHLLLGRTHVDGAEAASAEVFRHVHGVEAELAGLAEDVAGLVGFEAGVGFDFLFEGLEFLFDEAAERGCQQFGFFAEGEVRGVAGGWRGGGLARFTNDTAEGDPSQGRHPCFRH